MSRQGVTETVRGHRGEATWTVFRWMGLDEWRWQCHGPVDTKEGSALTRDDAIADAKAAAHAMVGGEA